MTTPPPTSRFGAPFEPLSIEEAGLAREFEPSSFLFMFDDGPPAPPYRMVGDVAVVDIRGPLDTRAGWRWDGYDAIEERVTAALADPHASALVLSIDSPGGMTAGNLDASLSIRARVAASGKPCIAHAGPMACSAAYAIACAADALHVTGDGTVGSIGVLATVFDRTAQNAADGLNVKVVRSGVLKADPHPDVPLTDASVARVRARVTELAGMFAAWVQQRRPGMGDPLALQGASVYGADAVTRGVADAVGTLSEAITAAASMAADTTRKKTMDANATKSLEAFASLRSQLGATTDEEALAAVATLRQRAGQVDTLAADLATARQQIAERDAATLASARAAILDKHAQRGALTPAMRADAEYMGDLAPLSPEALDRVLSKLPSVAAPVAPRSVGIDPKGVDPESIELTEEDKAFAKAANLSEAAFLATKRADAARASR
jgi:ClpP class serine protease